MAWAEIELTYFLLLTICIAICIKALKSTLFYIIIVENGFVISSGEFIWKGSLAVTDGDGNQMLRGRKPYLMATDRTGAVMDGDGLISHYHAGLYCRFAEDRT